MDLSIVKKAYTAVGKLLGVVNPLPYILQGVVPTVADNAVGDGTFNSVRGKYLGTNMTGQELQNAELNFQNQLRMMREGPQAQVEGAERAGINPAFALTGQAHTPSAGNTSSLSSGGSLSDLVAIATLPAQLKQIEATTKNIAADTNLKNTQSNINVQEERIRRIAADFGVEMTQAQINSLLADIAAKDADTELKRSQTDLVQSQTDAQNIANEYLPDKYFSEIERLDADSALARANEAMQRIQYEYARENGVLMSSNDIITLATYLVDLFGLSKGEAKSKTQKVVKLVNGANNWIDNKVQSASDWFDDKVVNRIRSRFKNSK